MPLQTDSAAVGVVGVRHIDPDTPLKAEEHGLLGALADQIAVAIERIHLAKDVEEAEEVMGSPARPIAEFKALMRALRRLLGPP